MSRALSKTAAALLLSFALIAGLAACGQSDKEKFAEGWKPLNADIVATGDAIAQGLRQAPDQTDTEFAQTFGKLATRVDGLVKDAGKLDPPSDVKSDYTDLIDALKASRDDLKALADAGANSDGNAASVAGAKLVVDAPAVRKARRAVNDAVNK